MRKNPERTAWIILSTAFVIFCTLLFSIPATLNWYIANASEPFRTMLTSVRGTVLIDNPDAELATSLVDGETTSVEENFLVSTNDTSQAILTFFDDSSVTLYSNTQVELVETQQPRFQRFSANPSEILVNMETGRIRITSSRSRDDLAFDIQTPHALVELGQGSFSVEVLPEETQVTSRLGDATVVGEEQLVALQQGERAVIGSDRVPSQPLPAAQNLLQASDFPPGSLETVWESYTIDLTEEVTPTTRIETVDERSVLLLKSEGANNIHTEIGVVQQVNKDVRDFQSLRLFAEIRLIEQSLPGGGLQGSEFPIMLNITYDDANGNEQNWLRGFYYREAPENYIFYNEPANASERILQNNWYPYESVNLLTTLGPTKPVFIKSVRIYASGWIYEAQVANISLLGEE